MDILKIGVLGCGYVSDFYRLCISAHPDILRVVGCFDPISERKESFAAATGANTRTFSSCAELLSCNEIDAVLVLTPPCHHAALVGKALAAGKHVICEKPLALDTEEARVLFDIAERNCLGLSCAPWVDRSIAARAMRRAIVTGRLGKLTHIYCDFDDGPLHRMDYRRWVTARGIPWPSVDEFGLGTVLHHAPYGVAWAIALAGPVEALTGFTKNCVPKKAGKSAGADLALAVLRHRSGCLTRLTVGALANRSRTLTAVGTEGEAAIDDILSVDRPASICGDIPDTLTQRITWPYVDTHRLNFEQGLLDLTHLLWRYGSEGALRFTQRARRTVLPGIAMTLALSRPGSVEWSPPQTRSLVPSDSK